jgi:hypothetical protein
MDDRQEAIEREKLKIERFKAWWTGISVVVSVAIGAGTLLFDVWSQNRTAELQFELKAAEIALNTDNPAITKKKSVVLGQLFPNRLPPEFSKGFDPILVLEEDKVHGSDDKKMLIRLLAERPQQRAQILSDWKQLFPSDQWSIILK